MNSPSISDSEIPMQNGFFITSAPKSGTHLLATLVSIATGESVISVKEKKRLPDIDFSKYDGYSNLAGHYRIGHVRSSTSLRKLFESRNRIVLIRDPRDLCNSMLHYLECSTNQVHKKAADRLRGLKYEERIIQIADGVKGSDGISILPSLRKWSSGFVELLEEFPESTLIRYEDFFVDDSLAPSVSRLLQVPQSTAKDLIMRALQSGSKTKRISGGGRPRQWEQAFSDELKNYFASNYAELIHSVGYRI